MEVSCRAASRIESVALPILLGAITYFERLSPGRPTGRAQPAAPNRPRPARPPTHSVVLVLPALRDRVQAVL